MQYCLNCFKDLTSPDGKCGCGFDNSSYISQPHQIPPETILSGKYMIGRILGEGGFGITYCGYNLTLQKKVAIKEFYPSGCVYRNSGTSLLVNSTTTLSGDGFKAGKEKCLQEARALAKLDDIPGVVRVRDFFEGNNTVYVVMDFVEGETLKNSLMSRTSPMPFDEIMKLFTPLMNALGEIHRRGFVHRDISPDNIIIKPDGKATIVDFGAAKKVYSADGNSTINPVLKRGFSPIEQYSADGKIGAWTDVYAFCATLYYCITGKPSPEPMDRLQDDETWKKLLDGYVADNYKAVILRSMEIRPENRYQSMEELSSAFKSCSSAPYSEINQTMPVMDETGRTVPVGATVGAPPTGQTIPVGATVGGPPTGGTIPVGATVGSPPTGQAIPVGTTIGGPPTGQAIPVGTTIGGPPTGQTIPVGATVGGPPTGGTIPVGATVGGPPTGGTIVVGTSAGGPKKKDLPKVLIAAAAVLIVVAILVGSIFSKLSKPGTETDKTASGQGVKSNGDNYTESAFKTGVSAAGNSTQDGQLALADNGRIYFTNDDGKLAYTDKAGEKGYYVEGTSSCSYINTAGDKVYFASVSRINCFDSATGKVSTLYESEDIVHNLVYVSSESIGERLFFLEADSNQENRYVYSLDINGENKKKVSHHMCKNETMIISGEYVFYVEEDSKNIYRCNLDGSDERAVCDVYISWFKFAAYNDSIYYADNEKIVKADYSGTLDKTAAADGYYLNVCGGYVFYYDDSNGTVTVFDAETLEKTDSFSIGKDVLNLNLASPDSSEIYVYYNMVHADCVSVGVYNPDAKKYNEYKY